MSRRRRITRDDWFKWTVSGVGVFLFGFASYARGHSIVDWWPALLAGLEPLGGYLLGLFQTKPGQALTSPYPEDGIPDMRERPRRRTPEDLGPSGDQP